MRHVFGVTVKSFNYEEEIEESLKLDYLVMASTSREIEASGDLAVFYIAVMNNNFALQLHKLAREFAYKAEVELYIINPDYTDFKYYMKMIGAKVSDVGGKFVIPAVTDKHQRAQLLKFAEKVGSRCLKRVITIRESKIQEVKNKYAHPSGLDWAYYGIIPD